MYHKQKLVEKINYEIRDLQMKIAEKQKEIDVIKNIYCPKCNKLYEYSAPTHCHACGTIQDWYKRFTTES